MTTSPRGRAVLRGYFAYRFVAWFVDYLVLFGVPVICFRLTGSLAWSGVALTAEWAPRLLSLAGAGYLVDRLSIRKLCLASDAARCVAAAICVLLVFVDQRDAMWVTIGLSATAGVFFEQTFVAGEKAGKVLAPEHRHAAVQTTLTGLEQLAIVGAPAVGGALLLVPPIGFLAVVCTLYGISALLASGLPHAIAEGGAPSSLLQGLSHLVRDPVLRPVAVLACGLNYVLGLVNGSAPQLISVHYGAPTTAIGYLYSAASVASILVLALAPRLIRALGLWAFGATAAIASPCICALMVMSPNLLAFGVGLAGFMALDALYSVFMRTGRVARVPANVYGSTVAAFGLAVIVPIPAAGVTLALLGDQIDPRLLLAGASAMALALALLMAPVLSRHRSTPWPWPASPAHQSAAGPRRSPMTSDALPASAE